MRYFPVAYAGSKGITGKLAGPANADLDLSLEMKASASAPWSKVAVSAGAGSSESVQYNTAAVVGRQYRWVVTTHAGTGLFALQATAAATPFPALNPCNPNTCNANGTCSFSAGVVSCICKAGYTGMGCKTAL